MEDVGLVVQMCFIRGSGRRTPVCNYRPLRHPEQLPTILSRCGCDPGGSGYMQPIPLPTCMLNPFGLIEVPGLLSGQAPFGISWKGVIAWGSERPGEGPVSL